MTVIRTDPESKKITALLYGDLQGSEYGHQVELNNSVLLGREVLTVPGVGAVAGLFVGRGWIVIVMMVFIIAALIPWERLIRRRKTAN